MNIKNQNTPMRARPICCAMIALAVAGFARAATLTLDYNGFNPGTDVIVYTNGINAATFIALTNHPSAVAGDTEMSFPFDLAAAGTYIVDLCGGLCKERTTHRIRFVFDGTDIDSLLDGANMLTGFTANTNRLTLNTVPVFIDPDGFNPPDDSPDGYIVQLEYGTSGRVTLDDFKTFANGGRAGTVLNGGFRYMIHYVDDRDSLGQQFVISNGLVSEEVGLIDEGTTTDASGNESGDTHQLVRLNRTQININLNGLSHAIMLGDADSKSYPMDNLPAGFNGTSEVLIHTDFGHTGYKFAYTIRLLLFGFDVNASGDIIELNDDRASSSGNTITFNTAQVEIDVTPATTFSVQTKSTPTSPNTTAITGNFTGDQILTLMPITSADPGVYFLGGNTTDARNTFRIVRNPTTRKYSLTTWTDSAGTTPLTGEQSITLSGGIIVKLIGNPLGTVFTLR